MVDVDLCEFSDCANHDIMVVKAAAWQRTNGCSDRSPGPGEPPNGMYGGMVERGQTPLLPDYASLCAPEGRCGSSSTTWRAGGFSAGPNCHS